MQQDGMNAVILAAGKGTRMKSADAKVLHRAFGRPMVDHVIDAVEALGVGRIIVVTGHQRERVEQALAHRQVVFARQLEQLGTGHAVLATQQHIAPQCHTVLILCGDTPLITAQSLTAMVRQHSDTGAAVTVMTTVLAEPANYGRILLDEQGGIRAIVEEKDATAEQRRIQEINGGIYCVDREFLFAALARVGTDNQQGEMYLTDIVGLANEDGLTVGHFICREPAQVLGVNSRIELAQAEAALRSRKNRQLMAAGVTMLDPATTYIDPQVMVGPDTILEPNVHLRHRTVVGARCRIGALSVLADCTIADDTTIAPCSYLQGQTLSPGKGSQATESAAV